jgi:hypothetical protein
MSGAFYAPRAREGNQILQIKSGSWPNGMKLSPKQSQNREVIEL